MPRLLLLSISILALSGCENQQDRVYDFKGRVVSLDAGGTTVMIDHEDIPGLMRAMKMPFWTDDPEMIKGLVPGMTVEGKMRVASGKYMLTELKRKSVPIGPEREIQEALSKLVPADRRLVEQQSKCPISGEALGTKGLPVKLAIKEQAVFLCCKDCIEEAKAKPDETVKKIAELRKH